VRARAGAGWAGGRVGRAGGRGRGGQGRVWTSKSHWLRVYGLWFRVYGLVFRYLLRVRSVAFGTGPVRRVWRPMRLPCIDKACLVSTRSLASHALALYRQGLPCIDKESGVPCACLVSTRLALYRQGVWRPMRLPCIDKACLVSTRSLASHAANLWVRRSLGLCLRHSNSRQSHKMTPRPPPCSQPMHLCVRVNRE